MQEVIMKRTFTFADLLIYLVLIVVALSTLLPFVYIISISVSSDNSLANYGAVLIPHEFSIQAYVYLMQYGDRLLQTFANSIFITVVGTLISLIVTSAFAYPLSRKYLPYRSGIMVFVFITMLFGGGLIPYYLTIKEIGLLDSIWSVILPGAISSWNMILMRNFFMEIPAELEESARMDGASDLRVLYKIFIPISLPMMATIGLFYAVGYWNNWFTPLLFLNNSDLWPLMIFLKQVIQSPNAANEVMSHQNSSIPPSESLKMAVVVVATVPILVLYPFLQKHFVKGMIMGSIKG
jgi:putative aldouronate transport system permease protein